MSTSVLRPQPRLPELNGFIKGIDLRWKTWFKHLSPAWHTRGWHSYIIDRLIQFDSWPHGASSSASQVHCGISSIGARQISTSPIGTLTYTQQHKQVCNQVNDSDYFHIYTNTHLTLPYFWSEQPANQATQRWSHYQHTRQTHKNTVSCTHDSHPLSVLKQNLFR